MKADFGKIKIDLTFKGEIGRVMARLRKLRVEELEVVSNEMHDLMKEGYLKRARALRRGDMIFGFITSRVAGMNVGKFLFMHKGECVVEWKGKQYNVKPHDIRKATEEEVTKAVMEQVV